MQWINEPPAWSEEGEALTVTTGPKTDFWRKTHYGFVRDNGHVYAKYVSGDFVADVKVSGDYHDLYDHAGLMVRLDEATWLKCGVEYVKGVQYISVVVTNDYSNWAVVPAPANMVSLWLRVIRQGDSVEVHYSLDREEFQMLCMVHLTSAETLAVGPMCASPEGNGFNVRFEEFRVHPL